MRWNCDATGRWWDSFQQVLVGLTMVMMACARSADAQAGSTDSRPAEVTTGAEVYQTFYLTSLTQPNDANDVVTDLRNILPRARLYYVASQSAISIRATPEDIVLAKRILADMDLTRKIYRLTYSIAETEGGKQVGVQRVALILTSGGKSVLKQGTRVPVATGIVDAGGPPNSQVQYVDVGLNIEASLEGNAAGLRLRTRVEQSSVAEEKSGLGTQDPLIRQTSLDDVSSLTQGKPIVLGSFDTPGGTRHREIEVVSELVE
jgi:type II secretory pathway component GspD/PulD (secretin)